MRSKFFLLAALLLGLATPAHAQSESNRPWEEYDKLLKGKESIGVLGPDLFGDSVNFQNGALSFSATDINLPGNNKLPVALTRTYSVRTRKGYISDAMLADWELDLPHISGVFGPSSPSDRCSGGPPSSANVAGEWFSAEEFWHGNQANMPGGGEMLLVNANTPKPTTGGPYVWVTSGFTYFSCFQLAGGGEGFLAITSDGTTYRFDHLVQYVEPSLKSATSSNELIRRKNVLYATLVQDRFGNSVVYNFNGGQLASIVASDGRRIDVLEYTLQGHIKRVSDGSRQWSYEYVYPTNDKGTLTAVVQPDTSRWTIDFAGLTAANIRYEQARCTPTGNNSMCDPVRSCGDPGLVITGGASGTITHPSGAVGEFFVEPIRHGRSNVPMVCANWSDPANNPNDDVAYYPLAYDALSLTRKRVTGSGIPAAEWNYGYGSTITFAPGTGPVCYSESCMAPVCLSDACAGTAMTVVAGPEGQWTRYTFGNSYRYNDGKLLSMERGTGPTAISRVETNTYELAQSGQAFATPIGTSPQARGDGFTSEYLRPQRSSVITQDGATFSSAVAAGPAGFDAYARPLRVTKSSSLGCSACSRTDTTVYNNNLSLWVLGQVESVTNQDTGKVVSQTAYDPATALPLRRYAFGNPQPWQTLTYNADGSVATVRDGNNNVTTLSGWKRGIPQSIKYPATPEAPTGATESAVVNDDGTIASVTDENGYKTCYAYDAMGRVSQITYPSETQLGICDASVWTPTTISFTAGNLAAYGLPAGHWRQTTLTGNGRRTLFLDALWRPVVEQSLDLGNVSGTDSEVIKRYDASERLAFQSYPMNTVGQAVYTDTALKGTRTTYDALDRVTQIAQDNELSAAPLITTTEYLAGFKTRVTNPRGLATTTSYLAYDQPTTDWPTAIAYPSIGAYVDIERDVYGKPLSLTRRNISSTLATTRTYLYGGAQRLCLVTEPETGSTVSVFDGADNLAWSASGLTIPSGTSCADAKAQASASGRVVNRTYDARNRVVSLSFPDGRGNTTHTYHPDGLTDSVVTDNGDGNVVTTAYSYNKRRLLTQEGLAWSALGGSWLIDYGYNSNGHLASQNWHGLAVDYAPNALGQATRAGNYATGVSYHPNGAIKQFTYGNGLVHTLTQNARGLPDTSCDAYGACGSAAVLFDGYNYDANGNVAAITDGRTGNRGNRTMTYDGLDRLSRAESLMFGATATSPVTYAYDLLDNLTRVTVTGGGAVPGRDHFYCYDTQWRLTNVKTGSCNGSTVIGLGYDVQGNLANKNGTLFDFDYGNRLRMVGTDTDPDSIASYVYDGLGRRVRDTTTGWKYSQYNQSGQLALTSDSRSGRVSEYITLGGSLVAIRERDTTVTPNVYTTKYQHTDALGSPVAVTDANRVVIEKSEYEPFGQLLNRPLKDGPGFTGHVLDAATGLNYMQQRYYDPGIGRFLSVDPVEADADSGDNFNRYAYANNSPYTFTDPDGRNAFRVLIEVLKLVAKNVPRAAPRTAPKTAPRGAPKPEQSPQQRGRESEKRVLDSMGEKKNTEAVDTSKGRTIPDFKNEKQVGEIKDTQRVTDTKQLQAQREHAKETGREHTVVTGTETKVSKPVEQQSTVIRRDDLGPKK